jgi:hypothetical protein
LALKLAKSADVDKKILGQKFDMGFIKRKIRVRIHKKEKNYRPKNLAYSNKSKKLHFLALFSLITSLA